MPEAATAAAAFSMYAVKCGSAYGHARAMRCRLSFMRLFWNHTLMVLSGRLSVAASSHLRGLDT